ncbi:MAG: ADOP family duplicated permease [Gemmatimonadaceae bacterium]
MKRSFWRGVPGNWRSLLRVRVRTPEEDVEAELRFHFDERIAELTARGTRPEDARATASAEFGDIDAVRDRLHIIDRRVALRQRRAEWWESAAHDLRIALRRLRLTPTFTIAATLTLAIAIGATASVFSVVDGVVLRAFPLNEPDRLLTILESNEFQHLPRFSVSPMNFVDWQAQNHSFTALAASQSRRATVIGAGDPERVSVLAVTGMFFDVLRIAPAIGRALSTDSSGSSEVVVSNEYWKRALGGARSVLGRTMILDNVAHTIVGVLPPGAPGSFDVWTQLKLERSTLPRRDWHYLSAFGRLKPGVTAEQGTRDLQTIAARLAREYPQTDEGWSVVTLPLQDALVEPVRKTLITLLAAAGCVLLIGIANLANLLLVRFLGRRHELAVRTALGATRTRLFGELLAEAAIIGVGAATVGVGLAFAGVRSLRALAPSTFPRISEIRVDGQVLAFCALTSIAAAFIFAALPAWQLLHGNPEEATRDGERGTIAPRGGRLQAGLVVIQVAVAFVLLAGAGLFVETFVHFQRTEFGFNPEGVLTADVSLPGKRYSTPDLAMAFASGVVDRLAAEPGVGAAAASSSLPGNTGWREVFTIVGDAPADLMRLPNAHPVFVTPDYFRAMGITVKRGRGVLGTDRPGAVKIAVVDEALARRAFPQRDPIGLRIALVGPDADTVRIVGVASTVKQGGLVAEDVPWFYLAMAQAPPSLGAVGEFVVRTTDDPMVHASSLRRAVTGLDQTVPLSNVEPMSARVAQTIDATRFSTFLASLFAAVALVLSLIGIYSVLAYVVAQRRREIAIRLALGADAAIVMRAVLYRALALSGLGIALGSGAAWWLTRATAALFEGVRAHDPRVFAGAAVVFVGVAVVAAAVPAFRTTRVDPLTTLRAG